MQGLGSAGILALSGARAEAAQDEAIRVAGRTVEVGVTAVSPQTVRISVLAVEEGRPQAIPSNGSLVQTRLRSGEPARGDRGRAAHG